MLAGRRQAGFTQRGDLEVERRRLGHQAAHTALEVALHLLGRAEEGYVASELAAVLVEHLVGSPVLGQPGEREVGLKVRGAVVDGTHPLGEGLRQGVCVHQVGEGRGGIEVGHNDGGGHDLAVTELDAAHRAAVDDDAGDLDVAAEVAAKLLE